MRSIVVFCLFLLESVTSFILPSNPQLFGVKSRSGTIIRFRRLLYTNNDSNSDDNSSIAPLVRQENQRTLECDHVARARSSASFTELQQVLADSAISSLSAETTTEDVNDNDARNPSIILQYVSPNVAAASLRRMTQFQFSREELIASDQDELDAWTGATVHRLSQIASLSSGGDVSSFSVYALVDSLHSIARLEMKSRREEQTKIKQEGVETEAKKDEVDQLQLQQLAGKLVAQINQRRKEILRATHPSRLVDVLYALKVFGLEIQQPSNNLQTLQQAIYHKCTMGNALPQLSPGSMASALTILADTPSLTFDTVEESKFLVALIRRFRKQTVRKSATVQQLYRAIQAVAKIGIQARTLSTEKNGDSLEKIYDEANVMVYTVFREILQKHSLKETANDLQQHTNFTKPYHQDMLALAQVTRMISSISRMEVFKRASHNSSEDSLIDIDTRLKADWDTFLISQGHNLLRDASVEDLSKFMQCVEETQCPGVALSCEFVRQLGEHFLEEIDLCVKQYDQGDTGAGGNLALPVNPASANAIFRCSTNWWGHNNTVMRPFGECGRILFTQQAFLDLCQPEDLTHFLTFLDKTRHLNLDPLEEAQFNNDPLLAVADRILDNSISEEITPSQASRVLIDFTSAMFTRTEEMQTISMIESQVLSDLFHSLGGHLLTDDLSARDISSALRAYAKASYVQDMGIFDHLATLMAARLDHFSIRQMSQGLWACGKMSLWEQQQNQLEESCDEYNQHQAEEDKEFQYYSPPYLPSAIQIADCLSRHKHQMTSQDVAQAIWAIGRLHKVQNDENEVDAFSEVMDNLLSRARILAPRLTSQEAANILWGMSMAGYKNCDPLVQSFIDRILYLHAFTTERSTPVEAASMMLAFGRMEIQNEQVFEVLSNAMLEQIEVASAQAIANALWAHRQIHIPPPRQLMDHWAIERLGLVAVQPRRKP